MSIWQPKFLFWITFFVCLSSCDFSHFFLSILMVITSLELTRDNPDRNIFSINVELTSNFLPYKGLVHHHHQILNRILLLAQQSPFMHLFFISFKEVTNMFSISQKLWGIWDFSIIADSGRRWFVVLKRTSTVLKFPPPSKKWSIV